MLVSVVIPSYNHRRYVAQAIESVLAQSWPEVDLIVIDDGSTDGSPELIRSLLAERGGFRFVVRENRGLLATLNEGLALARGELFCELASDDYLPPDSIGTRARFLLTHPECVAVFADGCLVEDDAVVAESLVGDKRRSMFAAADPVPAMLAGALPIFSTGLVRCGALRAMGGFDDRTFRFYEDLDTPILLSQEGRLGFVDQPVIFRRQHETNVSSVTPHIRVEKVRCYHKLLQEPRLSPYRQLLILQFRRSLLALARHLQHADTLSVPEMQVLSWGWLHAWRDPRLFWLLLKIMRRFRRQKHLSE
jgi:alpha-1,3-rhamnosyltransferase